MAYVSAGDSFWQMLAALATDEGLMLYDAELLGQRGIRVIVERPERFSAKGAQTDEALIRVTSDDCARFCRRLVVCLSVEAEKFGLRADVGIDVCSPGVNRVLRLRDHFAEAIGERVRLVVRDRAAAEPGAAKGAGGGVVVGILQDMQGDTLTLLDEVKKEKVAVGLKDIERARVDFPF